MLVSQLMTEDVVRLGPDDDLLTARTMMWDEDVRHIPIVDTDGEIVGLVTHRDVVRLAGRAARELTLSAQNDALSAVKVRDFMTTDVATIESQSTINEAAEMMLENKFGCLPVVIGTRLAGILTESDFVRLVARS